MCEEKKKLYEKDKTPLPRWALIWRAVMKKTSGKQCKNFFGFIHSVS